MPEKCQFEEDCFQQQVDAAIARLTNIVTTPGRVTENILGYDGAYFIPPDKVFSVVGLNVLPSPPSTPTSGNLGITVNPTVWKDLAKLDPAKIPKFRLNLFIQYKSPEKVKGPRAKEWQHWHSNYYRYRLQRNQLNIMAAIDSAGGDALGCYCSPAFIDSDTLWKCMENGKILTRSHMVRAQNLSGHARYTYKNSAGAGKGFSEPEDIFPEDGSSMILQAISVGREMDLDQATKSAVNTIINATDGHFKQNSFKTILREMAEAEKSPKSHQEIILLRLKLMRAFELFYRVRIYLAG